MSQTTDTPSAPPATGSTPARADIQGLRAFAVVAVILEHALGWPRGGFAGVDVFFVISGFLITDMLLREGERTGSISLWRFYGRRVRRIAPSALVVIAVTVAAGHFLFNQAREWTTLWDAGYALVFLANWHFGAVGTDYFHATDPASPLQHYWSLSVEEQFYLVWPGLLMVVLLIATAIWGRGRGGRLLVGVLAGIVVAVSFGFAVSDTAANPTSAYFSTFTRVWELGAGALVAAALPALTRLPLAVRFVIGWVGLLGVLGAFFAITDILPFPGPWAAFPVVATALVIVGGIGSGQRYLVPLANPVSVYLGTISYSLYLWHFPVLAFLAILLPTQTTLTAVLVLGLILAISIVSYYLVEQPFHRSPLFEPFAGATAARRAAWQSWRERFGSQFMLSAVGVAVIAFVLVVSVGNSLDGENLIAASDSSVGIEDSLQADLAAAVSATAWPNNLSPTLDSVMITTSLDNPAKPCFEVGATPNLGGCTWGNANAPHHAYLVGDSTALAYAPAFKAIAEGSEGQWKITTVGLYGCRFTDVLVANDGQGVMAACPGRKADIAKQIVADKPELVVVSNAYAEGVDTNGGPLTAATLVESTVDEMKKLHVDGSIVYLAPPPLGAELGSCYSPVSSPQACTVPVDETWLDFADQTEDAVGKHGHFVSSLPFSCYDGKCPAFAGTLPTKYDTVHMTVAYSTHVAPVIRNALVAAGVM